MENKSNSTGIFNLRFIIVSHSHPEITKGGAENAAYTHFKTLQNNGYECLFLALTTPEFIGHDARFGSFRSRSDELLWIGAEYDEFRICARNSTQVVQDFREIISTYNPDILHFHHYCGIGLDILQHIKQNFPVKVYLTLHEYIAICNNQGQMIKTINNVLCIESSPSECSRCFSSIPAGRFFLRKERILKALNSLDGLIAPSSFLAKRYVDFGVNRDKINVIENLIDSNYKTQNIISKPQSESFSKSNPLKIGYFGQFTPFKGLDILLTAIKLLPNSVRKAIKIGIHGVANGEKHITYFNQLQEDIKSNFPRMIVYGPYRREEAVKLMSEYDWVVMPSIWWENSPVVLQEAKIAAVPALVSDIGGMAEVIQPGINGEHFIAQNSSSLADKIEKIFRGEIKINIQALDIEATNAEIIKRLRELYYR